MRTGITPAEALETILQRAEPLTPETVSLPEAQGRILAESVTSERVIPPADNSAMDGYAVRAADCAQASADAPVALPVSFEVPAGAAAPPTLEVGQAARILTGAPLPPGADSVVRQEDTERSGDRVAVRVVPKLGEHVRRAGEDVDAGDAVLTAGDRVGAAQIGMLASLGRSFVAVHRAPRVAILSGGDELVEPDGDISGGRIVSSNSYSIAAQCRELGAIPSYLGIARDTPEDLERCFRGGLRADLLVSSAGVSVGDRDFVRDVLEKLGCTLAFWGVQMKPGYPLAFGEIGAERGAGAGGPLVFGLPGNPVSAMMTFEQFVRPAILQMRGERALFRPLLEVRLGERLRKKPGRLHFVRVTLEKEGDDWVARSAGNQSSGALRSMLRARAILIFDAELERLDVGDRARVQVVDPTVLAGADGGF
ncbi:MAG: gephyrin-like molybdotransferase Glp [Myxococcota bacterium]